MTGWVVVAYLFGVLLLDNDRLSTWREWAGLAAWPVAVPVRFVWHACRRWRAASSTGQRDGE